MLVHSSDIRHTFDMASLAPQPKMYEARVIAPGITYIERFVLDPDEALRDAIDQIQFQQRTCRVYGRSHRVPRKEAWFGPRSYTFSGMTFPPAEMPPIIRALEVGTSIFLGGGFEFEHCLANMYKDGSDTVGWHSDDEPEMADPLIASISLGAPRDFLLRRKEPCSKYTLQLNPQLKNRAKVTLAHGSLLVMAKGTQDVWEHSLPRRKRCSEMRVNLTYRTRL